MGVVKDILALERKIFPPAAVVEDQALGMGGMFQVMPSTYQKPPPFVVAELEKSAAAQRAQVRQAGALAGEQILARAVQTGLSGTSAVESAKGRVASMVKDKIVEIDQNLAMAKLGANVPVTNEPSEALARGMAQAAGAAGGFLFTPTGLSTDGQPGFKR